MENISVSIREHDTKKLFSFITNGNHPKNWLIQGMPGCGIDVVFKDLSQKIEDFYTEQEKTRIIKVDFASLWTNRLGSSFFQHFIEPLPPESYSHNDEPDNLTSLLRTLRSSIKASAEKGWRFVYIFSHFDSVLKFPDLEEIQAMLNIFQSLCYENIYNTSNIVEVYRDIEDICRHTNYSDYYKIFGTNHSRIGRVSTSVLEKEINSYLPLALNENIRKITVLSGGYPEIADVLIRETTTDDRLSVDENKLRNLYSAALPFNSWIDCLSAEELLVLEKINSGSNLEKGDFFYKNKLLRKELLIENSKDETIITSSLFENFLNSRSPSNNSTNKVVIKRRGLLNPLHRELMEQLFSDRFLIELEIQQEPLPGDAYVYRVVGEDEKGIAHRPCIVKIDQTNRAQEENENLEIARQMLGMVVPTIIKKLRLRGQDAVILEYASADNKNYTVQQFAEYYQKRSPIEVAQLLEKVLGNVLSPLYRSQRVTEKDAKKLYYLPRLHSGEFEVLSNIAQRSRYFNSTKLKIPGIANNLRDPGEYLKPQIDSSQKGLSTAYEKLFLSKLPVGLSMAHGDLNPRNLLIDGIENIHVIDFSELKKEGARFLDFARLEAEIKFKLANITQQNIENFIALDAIMTKAVEISQLENIIKLPLTEDAKKLAMSVLSLRKTAYSLHLDGRCTHSFITEYLLCLLTQTLRISLFQDYTNDIQKEFAVVSAALIVDKLEKIIK